MMNGDLIGYEEDEHRYRARYTAAVSDFIGSSEDAASGFADGLHDDAQQPPTEDD